MADGLPSIQNDAIVTPSPVGDDGGFRMIASAFSSIAQSAEMVGGAIRRNETADGSKEAMEAFNKAAAATPAGDRVALPERKGGLLDRLGVRGASYENTVGLLTLQRAERDAKLRLAELAAKNVGSPGAFEAAATSWARGYLSGAPSEQAVEMEMLLNDAIAESTTRLVVDRESRDRDEARQATDAQIQGLQDDMADLVDSDGLSAFASPEFEKKQAAMIDLLKFKMNDPTFVYSPEQFDHDLGAFTDVLKMRAAGASVSDEIKESLDFGGVEEARSRLEEMLSSEEFSSFDRATIKKLRLAGEAPIEDRERKIKAAVAERKREIAEYQTENYHLLQEGILLGEKGLSDIEDAFSDGGKLTRGQKVSLMQQAMSRDKANDDLAEAQILMESGSLLNPGDSDHKKAVDLVFKKQGGDKLLLENPDKGLDLALAFTMEKGIIPQTAVTTLRAHISNGTTEQQGKALDSVARLLEETPAAARIAFTDEEIKESVYYRDLVTYNAPPEFAMTSIMKAREAKFDGSADKRRKAAQKLSIETVTRQDTMRALGLNKKADEVRVMGGEAATEAAESAYRNLFVEYYSETGDAARAKKQAAAVVGKHFGHTKVNGRDRVMMYPPENFYHVPGVDQKWMGQQLQRDVRFEAGEEVALKDIQLISDPQTAAEAQGGFAPTYRVVRQRADGALEAMDKRFAFNPGAEEIGVMLDNFYELEKAREKRESEERLIPDRDRAREMRRK